MAVLTGTTLLYPLFAFELGKGTFDLTGGTYKVMLLTSSYTPAPTTDEFVADISANETSAVGNGYARQTVTVTWTYSAGASKFTASDAQFTASVGSITGRYWCLYRDSGSGDALSRVIAYGLLDVDASGNGNDVTATDTNTITVDFHDTNGVFTI